MNLEKLRPRKLFGYLIAVSISLCCVCLVGAIGINAFNGSILSTPATVQVFDTPLPIPTLIALTYSAARTQTAIANPSPVFTATFVPAPIENLPTATIFFFELQTSAAETNAIQGQPTEYIYSTNTPFSLATQQLQPTSPSSSSCEPAYPDVCITGNPRLYCKELKELGIFHFRVLPPDPLGYDKDHDGIGCE